MADPDAPGHDSRPALVFLHGIGGGAAGFDEQVAHFRRDGRRVIAWRQPGYGGTAPVEPYTLAAIAARLLDELHSLGIGRFVPIGHSLGAMIALEAYALAPARIDAMVLAMSTPAFGSSDGDRQREFIAQRTGLLDRGATMADVAAGLVPSLMAPAAPAAAIERAAGLMAGIPEPVYRAALGALVRFEQRALLPTIAVPVLCLAAEHDRTAPPAVMQRMAERIPGARYACLAGLGHLAPIEDPAAFTAAVDDFLTRLPAGTASERDGSHE